MSWPRRAGVCALGLSGLLGCGGETDAASVVPGDGALPEPPASEAPPASIGTGMGDISAQSSSDCVALPVVAPRQSVLSYEVGCAVTSFDLAPAATSEAGGEDARSLLVGRWRLCGDVAYYGGAQHAGIEFGSNGRNQLLRERNGTLLPLTGGPRGIYYVLGSGQFMQRGELSFAGYAAQATFDATLSVLQLVSSDGQTPPLRYVRVTPDESSAAANTYSTSAASCSMVGVWDTALPSANPAAAFAFNERGEWFGGQWGSDLCASHSMYGTYNLETRGQPPMDNFDVAPTTELELVTNVGAGRCSFWFNAGFSPTFSADCNRVQLTPTFDNCTGGRGYLNGSGDALVRRLP